MDDPSLDTLVTDGYFFNSYLIASGKNKMFINLENGKFIGNNYEYFTITESTKKYKSTVMSSKIGYVITVTWIHEIFGKMSIDVIYYKNPQIDNGIGLSTTEKTGCVGLLVRNYKPKLMELPALKTLEYKKLHNKLKRSKNKLFIKSIKGKNEIWKQF